MSFRRGPSRSDTEASGRGSISYTGSSESSSLILAKHPMRAAVSYAFNHCVELNVFAAGGSVPINNNVSEREMKRVVLNSKNSLFVGNERGGRTAAILSSFTSTCRRHGVDPQRYLTQLLTNLPATPISQLDLWLPDRWKHNHGAPAG